MSKNPKQLEPSADSNRPITSILRTRRNNGVLNQTPSHAKLMIGNKESPYSQIQSITKTRSSSNLKAKSPIRLKNLSPNRSNFSIALKSDDSKRNIIEKKKNLSKNSSLSNSFIDGKEILTEKLAFYQKEASFLEIKLNGMLNELKNNADSSKHKPVFDIHKEVFEELIQKDKIFGPILSKIKETYENTILQLTSSKKIKDYKDKVKDLSKSLNFQLELNKTQEKKIEKLSEENSELTKSLERSEEICTEIQKRLCYITNYKVADIPKDEMK